MEKEVKKTLTSIEVPAVGKATALIPNIEFVASTFDVITTLTNKMNIADSNNDSKVVLDYDEAEYIMEYLDNIKDALLNK